MWLLQLRLTSSLIRPSVISLSSLVAGVAKLGLMSTRTWLLVVLFPSKGGRHLPGAFSLCRMTFLHVTNDGGMFSLVTVMIKSLMTQTRMKRKSYWLDGLKLCKNYVSLKLWRPEGWFNVRLKHNHNDIRKPGEPFSVNRTLCTFQIQRNQLTMKYLLYLRMWLWSCLCKTCKPGLNGNTIRCNHCLSNSASWIF